MENKSIVIKLEEVVEKIEVKVFIGVLVFGLEDEKIVKFEGVEFISEKNVYFDMDENYKYFDEWMLFLFFDKLLVVLFIEFDYLYGLVVLEEFLFVFVEEFELLESSIKELFFFNDRELIELFVVDIVIVDLVLIVFFVFEFI